jgi:hypothetical protein
MSPRLRRRARALVRASVALLAFFPAGELAAGKPHEELLRRECSSRLGRNEVTLFGNGTIRWREWQNGELSMRLAELGGDEVEAYVRRLAECDLSKVRESPGGVAGEWVERCEIFLNLPGATPRRLAFGRLDTHPLAFADLLRIAEELAQRALESPVAGGLPASYVPRAGDLLLRADQIEFEVVGPTADGNGIELRGRIQPLTLYLSNDDLRRQFVRLLKQGPSK